MRTFDEPQLLDKCGHTFCKSCIRGLRVKTCPLCRTQFFPADVRPNYALLNMLAQPSQGPLSALIAQQALASAPPLEAPVQNAAHNMLNGLLQLGVPFGLAQLVSEEDHTVGLRIFLLDNSGSTASYDGKYLDTVSGGGPQWTACSRWDEIRRMAIDQAQWNATTGVPCEFILLNSPSGQAFTTFREGIDLATVDPHRGDMPAQLASLSDMLQNTRPMGATPLAARIQQIESRIQTAHNGLVGQGRRIVVVVATDGLPTSTSSNIPSQTAQGEVVTVLRQISMQLPVFIVVRLCTDETNVVEFYNRVDEEEELPLEVIDDMTSEADEAWRMSNGWLTYTPAIHTIREGGTFVKFFDLLDERRLTPLEVRLLTGHILQREDEAPLPVNDAGTFMRAVTERVRQAPLVFDPRRKHMVPCVDTRQLRRACQPPGRFCFCFS